MNQIDCETGITPLSWSQYIRQLVSPIPPWVHQPEALNRSINLLISAAGAGNNDIVRYLLETGADVNEENPFGVRALHAAVTGRQLSTCQLLIGHGYQIYPGSDYGGSLIHLAFNIADLDILSYLVDSGLDVSIIIDENGLEVLACCYELPGYCYFSEPITLSILNSDGPIPQTQHRHTVTSIYSDFILGDKGLFCPRESERELCFAFLLGVGARLQGKEVIASLAIENLECVEYAIRAGGNVDEIISINHIRNPFQDKQATCLEVALANGNLAIARALLTAGAKPGPNEFVSALRQGDRDLVVELSSHILNDWGTFFTSSVLEAALHPKNPDAEVIELAFDICTGTYEGGSLCAAVQLAFYPTTRKLYKYLTTVQAANVHTSWKELQSPLLRASVIRN